MHLDLVNLALFLVWVLIFGGDARSHPNKLAKIVRFNIRMQSLQTTKIFWWTFVDQTWGILRKKPYYTPPPLFPTPLSSQTHKHDRNMKNRPKKCKIIYNTNGSTKKSGHHPDGHPVQLSRIQHQTALDWKTPTAVSYPTGSDFWPCRHLQM